MGEPFTMAVRLQLADPIALKVVASFFKPPKKDRIFLFQKSVDSL